GSACRRGTGAGCVRSVTARASLPGTAPRHVLRIKMALLADINRQDGAPELRRRTRLLYLVLILVFGALLTRLFFLQLVDGERYTFLSENNRVRIKRIPGTRGMVFDRQGQLLVDSRPSFDLLFVAEDAEEPEGTLRQLARYLRRDEKKLHAIIEETKKRTAFETFMH